MYHINNYLIITLDKIIFLEIIYCGYTIFDCENIHKLLNYFIYKMYTLIEDYFKRAFKICNDIFIEEFDNNQGSIGF